MTALMQHDWDNLIRDWSQAVFDQECEEEIFDEDTPHTIRDFLCVKRTTARAKFFLTYEGTGGDRGIWVPNAAIIKIEGLRVWIAEWCTITEISWE